MSTSSPRKEWKPMYGGGSSSSRGSYHTANNSNHMPASPRGAASSPGPAGSSRRRGQGSVVTPTQPSFGGLDMAEASPYKNYDAIQSSSTPQSHSGLGQAFPGHARQQSFPRSMQSLKPRRSTVLNCRNIALVVLSLIIVVLLAQSVDTHAKARVIRLTEASLQKFRGSSAASAICGNPGGLSEDEPADGGPDMEEAKDRMRKQADKFRKENAGSRHKPEAAGQELPLIPGFEAISDPRNTVRNRFLVPIYACNEQETGSQMHVRTLLQMSKMLNRTLVLPNWGFGAPSISNCRPYPFDAIYETQSANEAGLWNVNFPKWWEYVWRDGQSYPIPARLAVIFPRDNVDRVGEIVADDDEQVLSDGCLESEPFEFVESAQYIAAKPFGEDMEHLVSSLAPSADVEVLFVHLGFCGEMRPPRGLDPLIQARPVWGLWSGRPWPMFNYSEAIKDVVSRAQAKLPAQYAAMQWRMELQKPETLARCSDMFAETIIVEMRERGMQHIYVASDMPIDDADSERSKSASFNPPEVKLAKHSIDRLVYRLREASFTVHTWETVEPEGMDKELSAGASGIFDRLMLGGAERLYAGNINCAFRSSYLGSIQTLRQDRIGDPTETDWEKLGMKWIGEPMEAEFWWPLMSNDEKAEQAERERLEKEKEHKD